MLEISHFFVQDAKLGIKSSFKQFHDAFLNASGDFLNAFFIGLFFGHGQLLSNYLNCMLNFVQCIDFIVQTSYNIGKKGGEENGKHNNQYQYSDGQ